VARRTVSPHATGRVFDAGRKLVNGFVSGRSNSETKTSGGGPYGRQSRETPAWNAFVLFNRELADFRKKLRFEKTHRRGSKVVGRRSDQTWELHCVSGDVRFRPDDLQRSFVTRQGVVDRRDKGKAERPWR